jgi:hypothetical protein
MRSIAGRYGAVIKNGSQESTTLAWVESALEYTLTQGRWEFLAYLEAMMDEALFEIELVDGARRKDAGSERHSPPDGPKPRVVR